LATFRNRFASIQDLVTVFALCIALVYSWSILMFFEKLPSWLLQLKSWDIIGIFAYTQTFALLESVTVFLVLMLLGAILPARFLKEKFVAQGSMLVLLGAAWAIAVHYDEYMLIRSLTRTKFIVWSVLCLASLGMSSLLLHRYRRVEEAIKSFTDRVTVLLYVYIPVACLSITIVVIRRIF
jgi:hypothetical protein